MRSYLILLLVVALMAWLPAVRVQADYDEAETEPNNKPGGANQIYPGTNMHGVATGDDVDMFKIAGYGPNWAAVVLLEATPLGSLMVEMLSSDGRTVLATDQNAWALGAAIVIQPYVDQQPHYVRVKPAPDHPEGGSYVLRSVETFGVSMPEIEPNDNLAEAQTARIVVGGVIDPGPDADVYAIDGQREEEFILALKGDPEGDGQGRDLMLELLDASGQVLATANQSGAHGDEVILIDLPADGLYYARVRHPAGNGNAATTYWLAIDRNRGLYTPRYRLVVRWEDPRTDWSQIGHYALVGDTVTFAVGLENPTGVTIPGPISLSSGYNLDAGPDLFAFVDAQGEYTGPVVYPYWDEIRWPTRTASLLPGRSYLRTLTLRAIAPGMDQIYTSAVIDYYDSGVGHSLNVRVAHSMYLPQLMRMASP